MGDRGISSIVVIAIAVVALSIAFIGYYFVTTEEREVEYKTYINENYSFKFDYPTDWIFEEWSLPWVDSPISQFLVRENVPEKEMGGVIYLRVVESDIPLPLENFLENFISWSVGGENFTVVSGPTIIVIDSVLTVKYLVKSTSIENTRIQIELISTQKDNYLYTFQLLAKEEKYHDYEPIFEHVIDSFSFL